MNEGEPREVHWLDRLENDRILIGETERVELVRSVLRNWVNLTDDETDLFLNPQLPTEPANLDQLLAYSNVERKVGYMYAGSDEKIPQEEFERRHEAFNQDLRRILGITYEESELDELIELSAPGDELVIVIMLSGPHHWAVRKIRNAYLPMITSFVVVDQEGKGEILDHLIFDSEKDPVDQLDELLGT